jgi:AcrR family transcriptional regulator
LPSSTPPKRSRLAPEQRRAQILDAARVIFAEQPYGDVSLSDIAREAGVSRSLLNHYFAGKVELLVELMQEYATHGPEALRSDLSVPVEEMVQANAHSWLDFVEDNRAAAMAMLGQGPFAQPDRVQEISEQLREGMVDRIIANHFDGDGEPPESVRLALRAYTGLFAVACHDWLVTGRLTRAQVEALTVTALLATLRDVVPAIETADDRRP